MCRHAEPFWLKVKLGFPEECWEWQRYRAPSGYGRYFINGKMQNAHRVALHLHTLRPLDNPLYALHSCDNPACCNPYHLRWGTLSENVQDCLARGRSLMGLSKSGMPSRAKLSIAQVRAIRADNRPVADVAADYGVGETSIRNIWARRTWAFLDSEPS